MADQTQSGPQASLQLHGDDAKTIYQAIDKGVNDGASGGSVSVQLDADTAQKLQKALRDGMTGAAMAWADDVAPQP